MRFKFLLLFCLVLSLGTYAQKKDKSTDNYTYIKLFITNAEGKILLLKWDNDWEVPGARYNAPYTISRFIDTLCHEDGINVTNVKLSGMYTVESEGQKKYAIMQYYSGTTTSTSQRVPAGCADIRWFTIDEALKLIPFEDMKMMVKKISEDRQAVWGAAIYKYKDKNTRLPVIEWREPFYKLN